MAEFFYMNSSGDIKRRRSCAPNNAGSLWAWYKLAMKVIPTIPNPKKGECRIVEQHATIEKIVYVLEIADGPKEFVSVNRLTPGM